MFPYENKLLTVDDQTSIQSEKQKKVSEIIAIGLKLPDLVCLYFGCCRKPIGVTKLSLAHNVTLCNSVTLKCWVTLELS